MEFCQSEKVGTLMSYIYVFLVARAESRATYLLSTVSVDVYVGVFVCLWTVTI